jgi:hypothetical protein
MKSKFISLNPRLGGSRGWEKMIQGPVWLRLPALFFSVINILNSFRNLIPCSQCPFLASIHDERLEAESHLVEGQLAAEVEHPVEVELEVELVLLEDLDPAE